MPLPCRLLMRVLSGACPMLSDHVTRWFRIPVRTDAVTIRVEHWRVPRSTYPMIEYATAA
jgi:hypothetical protein